MGKGWSGGYFAFLIGAPTAAFIAWLWWLVANGIATDPESGVKTAVGRQKESDDLSAATSTGRATDI